MRNAKFDGLSNKLYNYRISNRKYRTASHRRRIFQIKKMHSKSKQNCCYCSGGITNCRCYCCCLFSLVLLLLFTYTQHTHIRTMHNM